MFYIGHFSFDEIMAAEEVRHGYFTCVVEADSPDSAVQQFKEYIQNLKRSAEFFKHVVSVYLEDVINIPPLPSKPIMTRFQSSAGEFPKSVSYSIPATDNPEVQVYGLKSDVEQPAAKDREGYRESTPFLEF